MKRAMHPRQDRSQRHCHHFRDLFVLIPSAETQKNDVSALDVQFLQRLIHSLVFQLAFHVCLNSYDVFMSLSSFRSSFRPIVIHSFLRICTVHVPKNCGWRSVFRFFYTLCDISERHLPDPHGISDTTWLSDAAKVQSLSSAQSSFDRPLRLLSL